MDGQRLLASVVILVVYIAIILAWMIVAGGRMLDALLPLLGLPIAGLVLWWSGRHSPSGSRDLEGCSRCPRISTASRR